MAIPECDARGPPNWWLPIVRGAGGNQGPPELGTDRPRFAEQGGSFGKVLKQAYEEVEKDEDHHLYHTMGLSRELWIPVAGNDGGTASAGGNCARF
jgi:hypothetical protein